MAGAAKPLVEVAAEVREALRIGCISARDASTYFEPYGTDAVKLLVARAKTAWVATILDAVGAWVLLAQPWLETRATTPAAALLLFRHARARALELGVHRACTDTIDSAASQLVVEELANFIARMLEDADPVIAVRLGLGKHLVRLASTWPDLVPIDLLLAWSHEPAAFDVLCRLRVCAPSLAFARPPSGDNVRWLGSLAASDRWIPDVPTCDLAELVCRRRCAGLATPAAADRVRAELVHPQVRRATRRMLLDVVAELRDEVLLAEVLERSPYDSGLGDRDPVVHAIYALGHRGHEILAATTTTPAIDALRTVVRSWQPYRWMTVDEADARFRDAKLDAVASSEGAYHSYARILLFDPGSRHAAFQLAVIEHVGGTPIEPRRIAWLRELGITDEELLEPLLIPVAPALQRTVGSLETRPWRDSSAAELHLERVRHRLRP